jgi:predicted metal-dependent hydrolase
MKYDYTVIRSSRKTMGLEITSDLKVLVRAPLRSSEKDIDAMVEKYQDWIESHLAKQERRNAARPEPTQQEASVLMNKAKTLLPGRVAFYSEIMGLKPTGITITGAQKRFGSCSGKNRISFSWRLMSYPDPAIDYVVVHELAHIRHKNHGKDFYALIESVLPDYRERKKLLRN